MAMNVGPDTGGDDEVMIDINTTPLIDVMLVLLIMLIITIPVQTHAVKVDFGPPAKEPPLVLPTVIDILVDFDGTIYWNNDAIPDRPTLEAKFAEVGQIAKADQPEVHVNPNKLVSYKYVAEVMASAQHLGVAKLGLIGSDQFVEQ
jgi:biopolymer transport protein ExbD